MSIDDIANLEGKYFVFNFCADYTEDGRGVNIDLPVVLRVEKGKLNVVFDSYEQKGSALKCLKTHGVREVYCLFDGESGKKLPDEFLGFSLKWYEDEYGWGEYKQLDRRCWDDFFKSAGIKLKFLDEQKWYIEYAENLTTPK